MFYNFDYNDKILRIKEDNIEITIYISDNERYNNIINEFIKLQKNINFDWSIRVRTTENHVETWILRDNNKIITSLTENHPTLIYKIIIFLLIIVILFIIFHINYTTIF